LRVAEIGPGVEQRNVLIGIEQLLVLVLSVELDQSLSQVTQRCRGRKSAIHKGPTSALRGDFAAHDGLGSVGLLEDCLNGGDLLAGPHEVQRGASAEKQTNGLDENRLAGAGLSREHVERLFKLDGGRLDDCQVSNCEVTNHGRAAVQACTVRPPTARDGEPSFQSSLESIPLSGVAPDSSPIQRRLRSK
jgi:hypothetical protein